MIINVLSQTREARNIVVQERLALLLAGGRGAETPVLLLDTLFGCWRTGHGDHRPTWIIHGNSCLIRNARNTKYCKGIHSPLLRGGDGGVAFYSSYYTFLCVCGRISTSYPADTPIFLRLRQNKYLLSCRYSHFFAFAAE